MYSLKRHLGFEDATLGRMAQVLFLFYLIGECATDNRYFQIARYSLVVMSVVGILLPAITRSWFFWLAVTGVMALNVFRHDVIAANHHYVTVYVAAYVTIAEWARGRQVALQVNVPRAFIIVIFFFATLQKTLSSYFMSGRLMADFFLRDQSMGPLLALVFGNHAPAVEAYRSAHWALADGALNGVTSAPIESIGAGFPEFCLAVAISIAIAEGAVFFLVAINRTFHSRAMPLIMFLFVWATFAFRQEVFFFSLLSLTFMVSRPDMGNRWRNAFFATVGFFLVVGSFQLQGYFR